MMSRQSDIMKVLIRQLLTCKSSKNLYVRFASRLFQSLESEAGRDAGSTM